MKALVTGATGFIGSHIADRLLERGDEVRALVRPTSDVSYLEGKNVELAQGDVTDPGSLAAALASVDVVYHAAALVTDWAPWSRFKAVTVEGTRNVLEAAARAGVSRFLHVSSDSVYSHRYLGRWMTETTPKETRFPWWDYYRRSKLQAEELAWQYLYAGALTVTVVRPGLVLGERDRAILPGMITYLRTKGAAYLGNGRNRLPYVYVGDVAEGCVLAASAESAEGEAYNLASQEEVSQRDLFAAVAEEMGIDLPKRGAPLVVAHALALLMETGSVLCGRTWRPPLSRFGITLIGEDYLPDTRKAERDLGWRAKTPMREAIKRAIQWQIKAEPREQAAVA